MLNGVDARIALSQGCRAVVLDHILHPRFNLGLALQVHSAKPDARVRWPRQKRHRHFIAAVQADAGKGGRTIKCLLRQHRRIKQRATLYGKPWVGKMSRLSPPAKQRAHSASTTQAHLLAFIGELRFCI